MFKKIFCLMIVVATVCLAINIKSASAEDRWFYTAPNGDEYYLRAASGQGRYPGGWRGGYVVRVTAEENVYSYFFMIEHLGKSHYWVYHTDPLNDRSKSNLIEEGDVKGEAGGFFKASAQALYSIRYPNE